MKKRVFAIVPTVILCILLFYLIKPSQSPKSPYQNLQIFLEKIVELLPHQ